MKKIIQFIFLAVLSSSIFAKELITVATYNGASGSLVPFYMKILAEANSLQNQYEFVLLPKPGAQGLIALQYQDESPNNRLAVISPSFVDLVNLNQIKHDNYVPISSQGDACWVLISNFGDSAKGVSSLKGQTELVLGTISHGSSAHFTALEIGEQLGFKVIPVVFKSNFDALTLMTADNSINLVIETPRHYLDFKQKNPRLQALGITCSTRNPKLPDIKTLKEQGYQTPTIWTDIVANTKMPAEKRNELGKILDQALINMGQQQIFDMIDFSVPIFQKISTSQHFKSSIQQSNYFKQKFLNKLDR
jgi:tripartite-type tricarboxylate transporter receptor subunit TctC